jgi:putative membrane protein
MKFSTGTLAAAMVVAGLAAAHAADTTSAQDKAFVAMVSQGGMFEVKLGQLGAEQGSTQDLRDQGNTEAHDHQLVGDKLKGIMTDAGLPFPDALNAKFQGQLEKIKAMQGFAFDAAYLKAMEDVHAGDGAAFAKEAKQGSDPKMKAFAAETHRIVLRHIGELKAIGPS